MRGKVWLIVGMAVGIGIGLGRVDYFAGAASSLAGTAERLVGSAGHRVVGLMSAHGASRRVVEGVAAAIALLVPGVTAWLLMVAARGTVRLKWVVAAALTGLGVAAFFFLPQGDATGVAVLAFITAVVAMVATGPVVAAPLAALAAVIGTTFLPRLLGGQPTLLNAPVTQLHQAITGSAGAPLWLRVAALVGAALPFALALRVALE